MAMSRDEKQADAQLIAKGWELLGKFPDCVVWKDPSGEKYVYSERTTYPIGFTPAKKQ
jgi:hypothetical protein